MCKNSESVSQRGRGNLTLKEFGVIRLNQPVHHSAVAKNEGACQKTPDPRSLRTITPTSPGGHHHHPAFLSNCNSRSPLTGVVKETHADGVALDLDSYLRVLQQYTSALPPFLYPSVKLDRWAGFRIDQVSQANVV